MRTFLTLSSSNIIYRAGKTADQIIEHILEHEKINTGIDWKAAAAAGPDSPVWKAALNKAHSHLTGLKNKLNDDEKERAKRMGILNVKGMGCLLN